MANADWDERTVFLEALAKPPEQREAFLQAACPDEAARHRIRTLLRHQAEAPDDFLKMSHDSANQPLPAQIDEFRILHRIGEGGMGVVYLAEDTVLGRRVAVKVLARHMVGSEQALARFREEARSTAQLKHPAIVPVFRFGRAGDDHYLVSELVEGRTLAELIAERRAASVSDFAADMRQWHRQCAEIVATIADALDSAHRAGIVHRDVKPSNILIDRERGPRLTDFGIAKHLTEENRTRHTSVIGTCHYMSPEQAAIADTNVDHRSDIFSLGVVLYELLALRRPFEGATMQQVLAAVIHEEPARLRTLNRHVPKDLETICHKTLEKHPRDRYQTAAHVAADLRCFLRGDPILAAPPTHARRIRRWAMRHRIAVLAVTTMAAVAVAAGLAWQNMARARALMAELTLTTSPTDAEVTVYRYAEPGIDLGPATVLGRTPLRNYRLTPGTYRIALISRDAQALVETAVCLLTPGVSRSLDVMMPAKPVTNTDGMVYVGGFGSAIQFAELLAPEIPSRTVSAVPPFWIDRCAVTNAQYRRFVEATGYQRPRHWDMTQDFSAISELPVVAVTWEDAQAYSRWLGKRLPTAIEWEWAARLPDSRLVPWNHLPASRPVPVTLESVSKARSANWQLGFEAYRQNAQPVTADNSPSAIGLQFMLGNVRELTETILTSRSPGVWCKGGTWYDVPSVWDLRGNVFQPIETRSLVTGFRCVVSGIAGPHS